MGFASSERILFKPRTTNAVSALAGRIIRPEKSPAAQKKVTENAVGILES